MLMIQLTRVPINKIYCIKDSQNHIKGGIIAKTIENTLVLLKNNKNHAANKNNRMYLLI